MADFTTSDSHLPQVFNEDVVLEDTDEETQNVAKTKRPRKTGHVNQYHEGHLDHLIR